MLPLSNQSSSDLQTLKSFKPLHLIKDAFNYVHFYISMHPRRCFFIISILFLHFFIFFFTTAPPLFIFTHPLSPTTATISTSSHFSDQCESRRLYVYELPPKFNKELLGDCDDLDPWHWQCGIATNGGYGRTATEFANILPENMSAAWYRTNQFSLEIIYHHRILNYKCRTLEPQSATAFYIPFYAGLAVGRYLFFNHSETERDWLCEMLLTWVQEQPYWKRANGSDHFIALGRITWDFRRLTDPEKLWGSSFLNMPAMQKVTRLTIERAPADYYDVGVPYPTGFHPHSDSDVYRWQNFVRTRRRSHLTSFVGARRDDIKNDFRGFLLSQCRNESNSCRLVDCAVTRCSNGSSAILEALLDSDFCLQPKGDSFTRRSVFDCMIAGSIPVFFWKRTAYDQYEWFLPGEPESYSVFIDYNDMITNDTSVRRVLEGYGREDLRRMREKVIESIPNIVYANPRGEGLESIKDAFDIAVEGVFRRFKEQRDSVNGL